MNWVLHTEKRKNFSILFFKILANGKNENHKSYLKANVTTHYKKRF